MSGIPPMATEAAGLVVGPGFVDLGLGRIEAEVAVDNGASLRVCEKLGFRREGVLRHRDREQYDLHAWVVMPNHVHVLFTPREGFELPAIVQAWKSVSARRTNRVLASRGRLWQEDYFDRFIRNARHFHEVVGYIEWNPVDAGLCECPEEWPFGSARLGVT